MLSAVPMDIITWGRLTDSCCTGDYIMAIGPMQKVKADTDVSMRTLLAHQIVKLDAKLQREPMWYLEVIEYWTSVVPKIPTTA